MPALPDIAPDDRTRNFRLGIEGFEYADLFNAQGLERLLAAFDERLSTADSELHQSYLAYRENRGADLDDIATSELLVALAPHVGAFIADLFGVEEERQVCIERTRHDYAALFTYKRAVVDKVEAKFKKENPADWDLDKIDDDMQLLKRTTSPEGVEHRDEECATSVVAARLANLSAHYHKLTKGKPGEIEDADAQIAELREHLRLNPQAARTFAEAAAIADPLDFVSNLLGYVERWTYAAMQDPTLRARVEDWVVFKTLPRTDFSQLVHFDTRSDGGMTTLGANEPELRRRDGFTLTDERMGEREVWFEVDHCIYCHDRDRDSCSKGMRHKGGELHVNPLGVTLTGCPLEEKISEAHVLKRDGDNIASLALIMIDNPLCPGTGHRICNDCMKGCIYQKVAPVDIPQIETNVLTDVLHMPFGLEIYLLLTRWNPLNVKRPTALAYNGKKVLVVGMGPAGYTLAHYLMNEGFAVVGIDALKIEPLPSELKGDAKLLPEAVRDFTTIYEDLDERVMAGFGGVAEYGITVRWDKNFLKVIYLSLARRHNFKLYGGVRFGGTLTIEDAWRLGFDHIAIASGAGKPTVINLKNNLIRGIRKASDFLMALQLTGAAKKSSMANLQVRLPAGVIGGGLTAIDTATELVAYYPVQVEKILDRYEKLVEEHGEKNVRSRYDDEEAAILDEFLEHGRAIRAERQKARSEGREPDFLPLVNSWGGVTQFYRKDLSDSPAYRQNHEEVQKALEEGIRYAPCMNPVEAIADAHGHLRAVRFERQAEEDGRWRSRGEPIEVPLRSLMVAAGTSPNIIYETEHPGTFDLDGKFFRHFEPQWNGGAPSLEASEQGTIPKIASPAPFTSYERDGRYISFFGDNHPVYAGNVVKAMASAKDGYPYIVRLFESELERLDARDQAERDAALDTLVSILDEELVATVQAVHRLTPAIVEVVARAPMAARKFHPGQFYRIQNLESGAPVVEGTSLAAEALALTGAWVDREQGLISLITLEMGTSSKLCALWEPGQEIVVMGPTGAPTEIPQNETVLLAGGGLGNAVLFSIGKAMREAGNRVIYFAGYKTSDGVFKVEEIEAASDIVVWAVDPLPGVEPIPTTRPQDKSFVGNIVKAMLAYATGELGEAPIALADVDRIIAIGSDGMMAAVKAARYGVLEPHLKAKHTAIGSINSSMQCMMKGVCAQCLCRHEDPVTGEESFVYSCNNQDQLLDEVDFSNLHQRLRQNSMQEKLSDLWLDHLLDEYRRR
ncbi:MAG: FAD-dependent oxidoreductase [Gammaproteobacteria bacterium]|nr:FAD-dependent oxidoreductase [Gammaproteobacteria bacterium]NIM72758.1 FAD-dependent oxidoreductase [Gammaproteobacteria bacterium]NIN38215.1 FAD-dependent oxidoreductase [Gammaproteobacteria bacterium]NIO24506.1 FAD-dependent oxidoreductase [Gammaproteobacteria bacterium]NIO65115.1 FAD-dependent oxidoreductase [Gammaproteobacteria bacterium]